MTELDDGIEWLYSLGKFGIKLGLDNIRALLDISGNPQEYAKGVHIAGTNGKGSVAAMLSSILKSSGYRTGTYTSPHLVRFNERIAIDGKPISDDELLHLMDFFRERTEELNAKGVYPTFFEVLTAMAFYHFGKNADVWVVETGMGGRLDATNITRFRTGVISSVGMDHMQHLGDTLEKIAREKAGIIKDGMNVVSSGDASPVMRSRAAEMKAELFEMGKEFSVDVLEIGIGGTDAVIHGIYDDYAVKVPLPGRHQARNAAMAIAAAELMRHDELYIEKSAIISGIESAGWPGRFELVNRDPPVILDAAHNAPGALALSETLDDTGLKGEYTLVLGMLNDKDADAVASLLVKESAETIITEPLYRERAMKMEELMDISGRYGKVSGIRDPAEAVEKAMGMGRPVLVAGSIYLLGDVLSSVKFHK